VLLLLATTAAKISLPPPLGSIGHTDSVDVGGVTGLSAFDVGGCGCCYTEQGVLFRDDKLCVLTRAT
jgi:hypothetical protein